MILSLLLIVLFLRKRRAASREQQTTHVSRHFAVIKDANNPSTITEQEIDGNTLNRHKEMADTGIFELPDTPSLLELKGSTPTLAPNDVPNLRHTSARPGKSTENFIAKPFEKRKYAMHVSAGSPIQQRMKQMKTCQADKQNKWDNTGKSPAPDLNRALPPIPPSEDERFSWIKRNTVLDRLSDCQGIAPSPVPTLHYALYPSSQSENVRFSWIMRNMVLVRESNPRGIPSSDGDGVPWQARENYF